MSKIIHQAKSYVKGNTKSTKMLKFRTFQNTSETIGSGDGPIPLDYVPAWWIVP